MKLHYGDLNDSSSLVKIIASVKPTEIYNLGAMSHVKVKIWSRGNDKQTSNWSLDLIRFK